MPWDGELPQTWPGVAGLMVVGLVVIIAAQGVGGGMIWRWHKRNSAADAADRQAATNDRETIKRDTAAIKSHVANGHTEPLRADLDRLAGDVAQLRADVKRMMDRLSEWAPIISGFAGEVRGLRADIAEERENRRNLAADVRADMARNRDEVTDLHRRLRDASG